MNVYQDRRRIEQTAVYLLGRIEREIEDYSKSAGLPPAELTDRVVELLQLQAHREILRPDDPVSRLRTNGTRPRTGPEPLAVVDSAPHGPPRKKRVLSVRGKKAIRDAQRARWREYAAQRRRQAGARVVTQRKGYSYNGTHWTQQPKNRARMKRHMRQIRKQK